MRSPLILTLLLLSACATGLPEERHAKYAFPSEKVFNELPTGEFENRPYEVLGWVKARATFPTMEQEQNSPSLCRNYFNKAVKSLLTEAYKAGGEAVIRVRSVVMFMDGKFKEYPTPECSDDGAEGEVLVRGVAIKYKKIVPIPLTSP